MEIINKSPDFPCENRYQILDAINDFSDHLVSVPPNDQTGELVAITFLKDCTMFTHPDIPRKYREYLRNRYQNKLRPSKSSKCMCGRHRLSELTENEALICKTIDEEKEYLTQIYLQIK